MENQQVEVLGTNFNINSYSDEESIRTTLIEGSIKVSKAGQSAILKPGQQADITSSSGSSINIINDTDPENTGMEKRAFQFQRRYAPNCNEAAGKMVQYQSPL